MLKNVTFF